MNNLAIFPASHWINRPVIWNVLGWQAVFFLGLYILFGLIYWLALLVNSGGEWNAWDQTIINYGTKALATVPVYWLIFVKLKHWPLHRRLLLHLITIPLFIGGWLLIYHWMCDQFEVGYLTGRGLVWDIYIPFLFYFVPFGFLHFYEYLTRSQEQERKAMQLRQAALQNEVNALRAQLEPHFLFNTLNSISASVPPEMERTRELIAKLADTFRFGLQASQSDYVPLKEEIQFLKTYLDLEKQRFGERLRPVFEIEEGLLEELVPPMLLQPLVENAIKHGVGNSLKPVTVTIGIDRVGEELVFKIIDTGPGIVEGKEKEVFSKGIGLRNTQMILSKMFDQPLEVHRNSPHGLVLRFRIPIKK